MFNIHVCSVTSEAATDSKTIKMKCHTRVTAELSTRDPHSAPLRELIKYRAMLSVHLSNLHVPTQNVTNQALLFCPLVMSVKRRPARTKSSLDSLVLNDNLSAAERRELRELRTAIGEW
jgi:hypothetical protein